MNSTISRVGRENQVYSQNGARLVAGCICLDSERKKVILILSSVHEGKWVLPKGGVELDEQDDYILTAVRETWEEAGVEGKIVRKLSVIDDLRKNAAVIKGDFDPSKEQIPKTQYYFYELSVDFLSSTWPESSSRERRWCTYSEAKHELVKAKRLELLQALDESSIEKDMEDY